MNKLPRKSITDQIEEEAESNGEILEDIRFDKMISTGSTLLDLSIAGGRVRGGGIPGGILVEISGMPGTGKTALLAKIGANAQALGGFFKFADAERRLDLQYTLTYGARIAEENYETPHSVGDVMDIIIKAPESGGDQIDVVGVDSIAALISREEAKDEGDKRGQAKAKELHALMRKAKGIIAEKRRLVIFTNQLIDSTLTVGPKSKTPGGNAIPFYSSLRMKVRSPGKGFKVTRTRTIRKVEHVRVMGIKVDCEVFKSSIDDPFRVAPIYIMFGKGIDDIRANLEFIKRCYKSETYILDGQDIAGTFPKAKKIILQDNLEKQLRNEVIDLWTEIQIAFEDD